MEAARIGTTFHESFSLSRPALVQVISTIADVSRNRSLKEILREHTSLGTNYVKSMPRYAIGAGLLDSTRQLTDFGRYALAHDSLLEQHGTQWLMHYHLSAPHGPGPAFWHDLVANYFYVGHEFTAEQVAEHIARFIESTEGRTLVKRTVGSTATVFLGTYTKPDALGKLGILDALDGKRYRVVEPVMPPVWAVACALLDYWAAHYEGRLTVSLDTLTAPGGFVSPFLMGRQGFNEVLRALQAERYVEVYRVAPPEQVVLLRQDQEPLLQKLYGTV